MAFPTYINKGTFQSTTLAAGTTPSLPASIQNGDLLIAVVSTPNDTTLASADGDWTLLATTGTGTVATAGAIDVWVFYAIYNGVALGNFSTTNARLKCQQVYAFRNAAIPTVSATGLQTTAATAWTLPGITTNRADSFVFFAIGNDRDTDSTTNVSGYTNSNLANITELHDQVVSTGVGGGIATVYAEEATPSSIGTTSATSAASNTAAFVTFAIATPLSLTADTGSYTYSGNNANVLFNRRLIAEPGSYTYSGNNANVRFNRRLTAETGSYSYSGNNANVLFNRRLVAETGSYTYSGNNANVLFNRRLVAEPGSYTYSGNNANVLYNRVLVAEPGSYTYSGNNATLTYTTVGGYTITADTGTYSYSGNDANILYNRRLVAETGTYSYSGNNADILFNRILTADPGTYSYSGNNADILFNRRLVAETGAYSYSGGDAILTYTPAGFNIYFGSSQVSKIYLGTNDVTKAFLGTTGL